MYEAKNSKICNRANTLHYICWLLKRWHIYRVIDQNTQKLLFFAVSASYIACILKQLDSPHLIWIRK